MNPAIVSSDLKYLRSAVTTQRYTIFGLAGAVVLCLMVMLALVGRERTILLPPVIEKSFWVTHDKVSGTYLEQMAAFAVYLILDVSPHSIDWKKNLLLQYASPAANGELEGQQKLEADRLKNLNATTQFGVQLLHPDERDMTVAVRGRLSTFVNGQRTNDEEKTYLLKFLYTGNRIQLHTFEEMSNEAAQRRFR